MQFSSNYQEISLLCLVCLSELVNIRVRKCQSVLESIILLFATNHPSGDRQVARYCTFLYEIPEALGNSRMLQFPSDNKLFHQDTWICHLGKHDLQPSVDKKPQVLSIFTTIEDFYYLINLHKELRMHFKRMYKDVNDVLIITLRMVFWSLEPTLSVIFTGVRGESDVLSSHA